MWALNALDGRSPAARLARHLQQAANDLLHGLHVPVVGAAATLARRKRPPADRLEQAELHGRHAGGDRLRRRVRRPCLRLCGRGPLGLLLGLRARPRHLDGCGRGALPPRGHLRLALGERGQDAPRRSRFWAARKSLRVGVVLLLPRLLLPGVEQGERVARVLQADGRRHGTEHFVELRHGGSGGGLRHKAALHRAPQGGLEGAALRPVWPGQRAAHQGPRDGRLAHAAHGRRVRGNEGQEEAHGVAIGATAQGYPVPQALGGHPRQRAADGLDTPCQDAGKAEVQQTRPHGPARPGRLHEDVAGLQVPVDKGRLARVHVE
mmetsp:Transcript_65447/g.202761  ORF Transcript_65447/g.202761 Transcript_65447/m.202761 type:complete len:321 (+) Transcript_65447:144-1106(+)